MASRPFRAPGRLSHPTLDRSLGDVESEHLQFAMNPRCSPRRVLRDYSKNEGPQFLACGPSAHIYSLEGRVYVLHAFQKKSKSGIATPKAEIDLVKQRLQRAIELHSIWEKEKHG
jgi:hypothetical protein